MAKKRVQWTLAEETVEAVAADAASLGMSSSAYANLVLLAVSRFGCAVDSDAAADAFSSFMAGLVQASNKTKKEPAE